MIVKPTPLYRAIFFIFFDILISLGTLFMSYNLRFNFGIDEKYMEHFLLVFLLVTILKIFSMNLFNLYRVTWRFFSLNEVKKILYAHLITYPVVLFIYYLFPYSFMPFPRSVLVIDLFLSIVFINFFRISKRLIIENDTNINLKKSLIIGATSFSQTIIKDKTNFYVSAIVDDNRNHIGTYFSNMKVYGMDKLAEIVAEQEIKSVIIAKDFEIEKLNEIYELLKTLDIFDIQLVSVTNKEKILKSLTIEDLLARHPKDLDKQKIQSFIKDKIVLVTGAGGSIGSEICRQVEKFGAKKLILLDSSEYNLYTIYEELKIIETIPVMQSVVDKDLLETTFKTHLPEIVIHAAAYKHVPLVEANIREGILNNVVGTKNVIDLSIKYSIKKFVMISTDKAVRPTNVMGVTKRICELYAQNSNAKDTDIVAVRFGNVLGSSGSVIPKFKAQIESGKNITVTHPDITRYFMLINEACELVLQAASIGKGGEIFILDMGEPIKILDLAKKMIKLSGRDDISIEFSGLRTGEKLYEELLIDDSDAKTQYESITVAGRTEYDISKLNYDISELINTNEALKKLKEIVPEFNHMLHKKV